MCGAPQIRLMRLAAMHRASIEADEEQCAQDGDGDDDDAEPDTLLLTDAVGSLTAARTDLPHCGAVYSAAKGYTSSRCTVFAAAGRNTCNEMCRTKTMSLRLQRSCLHLVLLWSMPNTVGTRDGSTALRVPILSFPCWQLKKCLSARRLGTYPQPATARNAD